jgi:hypothetical protein
LELFVEVWRRKVERLTAIQESLVKKNFRSENDEAGHLQSQTRGQGDRPGSVVDLNFEVCLTQSCLLPETRGSGARG